MDRPGQEHEHDHEHRSADPAWPEAPPGVSEPDLERIAGDLADIERALERLDDGSYWFDEVTGEPIPDEVHAADPLTRRAIGPSAHRGADSLDTGDGSPNG